jgi:hypothetical protein
MELRGFEPLTFRLPAERSSQLSYSPAERVSGGGVYRSTGRESALSRVS